MSVGGYDSGAADEPDWLTTECGPDTETGAAPTTLDREPQKRSRGGRFVGLVLAIGLIGALGWSVTRTEAPAVERLGQASVTLAATEQGRMTLSVRQFDSNLAKAVGAPSADQEMVFQGFDYDMSLFFLDESGTRLEKHWAEQRNRFTGGQFFHRTGRDPRWNEGQYVNELFFVAPLVRRMNPVGLAAIIDRATDVEQVDVDNGTSFTATVLRRDMMALDVDFLFEDGGAEPELDEQLDARFLLREDHIVEAEFSSRIQAPQRTVLTYRLFLDDEGFGPDELRRLEVPNSEEVRLATPQLASSRLIQAVMLRRPLLCREVDLDTSLDDDGRVVAKIRCFQAAGEPDAASAWRDLNARGS